MKRLISMFIAAFRPDPNKPAVCPQPDEVSSDLAQARARNLSASENLRATLGELLDEGQRLAFRPVYLAGPRTKD